MSSKFNMGPGRAIVCAPWTSELQEALLENLPTTLELSGHWPDLSIFEGLVDQVQSLTISGTVEKGQISSIQGIRVFTALKRLTLVSKVKLGFVAAELPDIESLTAPWQDGLVDAVSAKASLRKLFVGGYPHSDLKSFPRNRSLRLLRLSNPAVTSLTGIDRISELVELDLVRAKKLRTMAGVEATRLSRLDIESARSLVDLAALGGIQTLTQLRLLFVNEQADLTPLYSLQNVRSLHVGGTGAPLIDWVAAMKIPRIELIAGWWDSEVCSEEAIRAALPSGRAISAFETTGKAKIRPLDVRLSDAGS